MELSPALLFTKNGHILKLSKTQLAAITDDLPEATPKTNLEWALQHARNGWHVFPLAPGKKGPLFSKAHPSKNGVRDPKDGVCHGECGKIGHGAWDGTTDPDKIRLWWGRSPSAGIGGNLGDDRIAFDVDLQHGGRVLTSFPNTHTHYTGRGNGNRHLIYTFEPGSATSMVGQKNKGLGDGMDIKSGFGGYVVLPPTKHEETGKPYTVGDENDGAFHVLLDEELQAIYDEAGISLSATARGAAKGLAAVGGSKTTKTTPQVKETAPGASPAYLSSLLQNPPTRGEGRTNDWLTRVAGHYAKQWHDKRDMYELDFRRAVDMVDPSYEEAEKIQESVWTAEQANHLERDASAETGWLTGNGRALFCQIMEGAGENRTIGQAPFADFDIIARGVAVGDDSARSYWVSILWKGQEIELTLTGEMLGDDRALRKFLSTVGATIDIPLSAFPKTPIGVRLQRYLESQDPAQVQIVDTLGWHEELGAFVTHEGVITLEGVTSKEQAGIVADPILLKRDVAPYKYGFEGTWDEAVEVLREVLTFQEDTVTAVFGAWWAACLLKPQIQTQTAVFPFFGIEAASESGKTNGFFALMVGMNGNTRGQIAPTKPVLRDSASANRNGIVWADDLDDLTAYGEILRASTSNGTASKMDLDRNGIKNTQIVAPLLISGEQLGMSQQKALADRSVVVNVNSPTERMSQRLGAPKSRTQWSDVKEIKQRFSGPDGLAVLAGHFAFAALQSVGETLRVLDEWQQDGHGRHGDTSAVLMAGACLLDFFLGHEGAWEGQGPNAQQVQTWLLLNERTLTNDNTLTTLVLPWALRIFHVHDVPEDHNLGRFAGVFTPAFIKHTGDPNSLEGTDEVWFSPKYLSAAWNRDNNNKVDQRTETETALSQQADRVSVPGSSRTFRIAGTQDVIRYRKLLPEYTKVVLERTN